MTDIVISLAKSLVCPYCDRAWPPDELYEYCPLCREETKQNKTREALDPQEARRAAAHFHFGWMLWDTGQL